LVKIIFLTRLKCDNIRIS